MDVKTGSGAFMPTHDQSMALARNIVAVADENGVQTSALLTDMNQVLGLNVERLGSSGNHQISAE